MLPPTSPTLLLKVYHRTAQTTTARPGRSASPGAQAVQRKDFVPQVTGTPGTCANWRWLCKRTQVNGAPLTCGTKANYALLLEALVGVDEVRRTGGTLELRRPRLPFGVEADFQRVPVDLVDAQHDLPLV